MGDKGRRLKTFNRTRRNWNANKVGDAYPVTNLLIVPEGIEIRLLLKIKKKWLQLLIVPEGIEIKMLSYFNFKLVVLLIVPEGIEIATIIPDFINMFSF